MSFGRRRIKSWTRSHPSQDCVGRKSSKPRLTERVKLTCYRAFISPTLHPSDPNTLPISVTAISPITGPAHPSIAHLSCALLHPSVPSCSTAYVHHILLSVPPLARFLTAVSLALTIPKLKSVLAQPITSINSLSKRIIAMTAVLSAAVGSAWGSVCLLNNTLPRSISRPSASSSAVLWAVSPLHFWPTVAASSRISSVLR